MLEKLKILVVLVLLIFIDPVDLFAQEFELGSRLYKQENGKWYNFDKGRKCDRIVPNRLIVRKKSKAKPTKSDLDNLRITDTKIFNKRYPGDYFVLNIDESINSFEVAEKIQQSTDFDYVEFDSYVSFCTEPEDHHYDASDQDNLESDRLDMPRAWDITTGSSNIILAFIDTGFEVDHEDLDGNLWINTGETPDDDLDNDNNGYVDDVHGWYFGGNDWRGGGSGSNNLSIRTTHGTQVLGIASAQTNNLEDGNYIGIAGIAGGWGNLKGTSAMLLATENSELYDSEIDSTYLTSVVDCIDYAMKNGADVINMSFIIKYEDGYDYVKAVIDTAVDDYDCVCVAATGNDGDAVKFPANYEKVIAVGSVTENDWLDLTEDPPSGSCWDVDSITNGREIDLVAPTNVYTTSIGDDYSGFGNTSASAPHVSALAALILSINDDLQPSDVRDILTSSTDTDIYDHNGNSISYDANGWSQLVGYGRINAYKALKKTIEEYGGTGATFTFNKDVIIHNGETLTIETGSTVKFYPGKRLIVEGTLIADEVNFTKASSSNWGGIRFENASSNSTIENCTITYADTGIILVSSNITIENNEISDIYHFGIYSTSSSPVIETNEIYDTGLYGIYAYGGAPEITDNYIHDIGDYGIALNNSTSSTFVMENSIIDCEGGVKLYGSNYANLRGKSGTNGAFNKIENYDDGPGTYGVMITGGSPELGNYHPTSEAGKNDFIHDGRDIVYESVTGEICAEKNYWGGTPQSSWFTGSVSIDGWYSSSQGGGSSLDLTKPAVIEEDRQLLIDANEFLDAKSFLSAALIYKQLIEEFPGSKYAGRALAKAMSAYHQLGILESQRSYLQANLLHLNEDVKNKALLWLVSLEAWSGNKKAAETLVNSTNIKDTVGVEIRLNWANDLVNVYNDLGEAENVFKDLLESDPWEGTIVTIEAIRKTAPGYKLDNLLKPESYSEEGKLPHRYNLGRAYPNPFNPTTTITYELANSGKVKIEVYDVTGRLVRTLINSYQKQGKHEVKFNGNGLSTGLYIYRMISKDYVAQNKMLLIK